MFKEGQKVKIIGAFAHVGETEEYAMLDPFEKGAVENTEKYIEKGTAKLHCESHKHELDAADFIKFDGEYKVLRSNEIFTKIEVGDHIISVPNNKLTEVE